MSSDEIFKSVAQSIADILGVEVDNIDMDAEMDSLGLNELTEVEMIMSLEDKIGIKIPEEDMKHALSGRRFAEYIYMRMKK